MIKDMSPPLHKAPGSLSASPLQGSIEGLKDRLLLAWPWGEENKQHLLYPLQVLTIGMIEKPILPFSFLPGLGSI